MMERSRLACSIQRSGDQVLGYLDALGPLGERRLTGTLGFLMGRLAQLRALICPGVDSRDARICIEESAENDRFDILVLSVGKVTVVEGKLGWEQSAGQISRYIRRVRSIHGVRPQVVLVDRGSEGWRTGPLLRAGVRRWASSIKCVTWGQIASVCEAVGSSHRAIAEDSLAAALAADFAKYLRGKRMFTENQSEILSRDLGDAWSSTLYFRHHIYTSQPQFERSIRGNLYFAPCFTNGARRVLSKEWPVPVLPGISYVSRIRAVELVHREDVGTCIRNHPEIPDGRGALELLREHSAKARLLIFLGEPLQMFVTPVTKSQLRVRGFMGSRSFTLEELLSAARRTRPKDQRL